MLSIPCWFIKLVPSQDETGLLIDDVDLSDAGATTSATVAYSKARFTLNTMDLQLFPYQIGRSRKIWSYIALVRVDGLFYTLLVEVHVGRI